MILDGKRVTTIQSGPQIIPVYQARGPKGDQGAPGGSDAAFAAFVGDPASATRGALSATYATVVTPEKFGAVGDGTTDDGTAWQNALDYGKSLGASTTVRGRAGVTYLVRQLDVKSNTVVDLNGSTLKYGGSKGGTTGPNTSEPRCVIGTFAGASDLRPGVRITNGTISGTRTGTAYSDITTNAQDLIYGYYAPGIVVDHMRVVNSIQDGICFDVGCDGGVMAFNTAEDIGDAAYELRQGAHYKVVNNRALRVGNGVQQKPNVDDVLIQGNYFLTHREAVQFHGTRQKIIGNVFEPWSTPDGVVGANFGAILAADVGGGAYTPADCSDILISGNTSTGRTGGNFVTTPSGTWVVNRLKITGNHTTDRRGAQIGAGSHVAITENTFDCTEQAITIQTGTNVTIANNNLLKNTSAATTCVLVTAAGTKVVGNTIVSAQIGLQFGSGATDSKSANNDITTSAGIGLNIFGARTTSTGDSITSVGGAAVSVSGADVSVVGGGALRPPSGNEGVTVMAGANRCTVSKRIIGGSHGVRVAANECVVTGTSVSGAAFWGVNVMAGATNTLVTGNMLRGNTSGGMTDAGTTTTSGTNVTT